ncbi:glycerate kinase [Vibrio viridaestus]|uniref:Glycerate kinase n=1 Tax=Vibrio viridaestus TaxID=2487322 RepID=A0A3N9U4X5_9VIBR|nr:glycerate kinase [Vibrio viridaestus]RQW64742.1 glycerate kinase [Vibrio viridaestus]
MKIVIAPDSFKESLTAMEVAESIENGFKEVFPEAEYVKVPMADGGEGTVQSIIDATGGSLESVTVTDPLGRLVESFWGLSGNGKTAVIEMAAASGIHLVQPSERNPLITSTYGTGELILAALDRGVDKIILGIGGSATNDAGCGMLQALGAKLLNQRGESIGPGGGAIDELADIDLKGLDPRLAKVTFEVACDVDNPLCGPKGASAVFGPQKGATDDMITQLDANLLHFGQKVKETTNEDIIHLAGAGAAGGLGGCLAGLCGAVLKPGVDIVIEAVALAQAMHDTDLVITGEGRIDSQTIYGKTPIGVAKVAKQFDIPVIGIAGALTYDCGVVHEHGIDSVFSVVPRAVELDMALKEADKNIYLCAKNIAALLKISL